MQRQRPGSSIFLKHFPVAWSDRDLYRYCGEFGHITSVRILNHPDGNSKGLAFVNYEDPNSARKAVERLNGMNCGNNILYATVQQEGMNNENHSKNTKGYNVYNKNIKTNGFKDPRTERPSPIPKDSKSSIYIRYFPPHFNEALLQRLFQTCGEIRSVAIKSAEGYTYAFVNYFDENDAIKAVKQFNNFKVEGHVLHVRLKGDYATERPPLFDFPAETTIYVTNFPTHLQAKNLENIFKRFGDINDITVNLSVKTPYAFINYVSEESVESAIRHANDMEIVSGFRLRVEHAEKPVPKPRNGNINGKRMVFGSQSPESFEIFSIIVENAPPSWSQNFVWKLFSVCGKVHNVEEIESGASTSNGFHNREPRRLEVSFAHVDSAERALNFNDIVLDGYTLSVKAKDKYSESYIVMLKNLPHQFTEETIKRMLKQYHVSSDEVTIMKSGVASVTYGDKRKANQAVEQLNDEELDDGNVIKAMMF